MKNILRRDVLEKIAHTIKTADNKIWVNLYDGRFILRESINWQKPLIRTTYNLYPQIECVISNELLIAKRDSKLGVLIHLDKPKTVKTLL